MSTAPESPAAPPTPDPPTVRAALTRRGWTLVVSTVVTAALLLVGLLVPIPYVSLGPGPTYDTLGSVEGVRVVQIEGEPSHETTGQLRMTTVSVNDEITLFGAFGLWVSGRYALAPREDYFRPGETEEDIDRQNTKLFQDSQSNAEIAALRYLKYPMKVIAQEITSGAPADKVLAPGDQLVEVNGKKVAAAADVRGALAGTTPGQSIAITYKRDGQEKTATIALARASDFGQEDRPEGFIGLGAGERPDVDFKTTIRLQNVGGPSAGLIFALAIIDRLTEEDLAGGATIAGTGEIDAAGNVGRIGGIPFKMVAAKEAGVSVFLVPEGNCAEAKDNAPDGLRLVKVSTLDGAVQALKDVKAGRPVPGC
ncbi:YlbL family protein [Actinokineospora diospyrosa]|uniref:endopeptidase La n=1 Tax=Actinokineospora diospyrosa TaxID=103728 RepID=A0ABT1I9Y2_9PSEU|nr:PDZ domain-containing protein [Actinokineospora diospyrosa]MCP2269453.1 PDZ domain-containing protein [Actinokineospora diospyrosa]